jgi:hypothetical protein
MSLIGFLIHEREALLPRERDRHTRRCQYSELCSIKLFCHSWVFTEINHLAINGPLTTFFTPFCLEKCRRIVGEILGV